MGARYFLFYDTKVHEVLFLSLCVPTSPPSGGDGQFMNSIIPQLQYSLPGPHSTSTHFHSFISTHLSFLPSTIPCLYDTKHRVLQPCVVAYPGVVRFSWKIINLKCFDSYVIPARCTWRSGRARLPSIVGNIRRLWDSGGPCHALHLTPTSELA